MKSRKSRPSSEPPRFGVEQDSAISQTAPLRPSLLLFCRAFSQNTLHAFCNNGTTWAAGPRAARRRPTTSRPVRASAALSLLSGCCATPVRLLMPAGRCVRGAGLCCAPVRTAGPVDLQVQAREAPPGPGAFVFNDVYSTWSTLSTLGTHPAFDDAEETQMRARDVPSEAIEASSASSGSRCAARRVAWRREPCECSAVCGSMKARCTRWGLGRGRGDERVETHETSARRACRWSECVGCLLHTSESDKICCVPHMCGFGRVPRASKKILRALQKKLTATRAELKQAVAELKQAESPGAAQQPGPCAWCSKRPQEAGAGEEDARFRRCARCKAVDFCSEACQVFVACRHACKGA